MYGTYVGFVAYEEDSLTLNGLQEMTKTPVSKCLRFYYAQPLTKVEINNIFSIHFYSSQLWDVFSAEANGFLETPIASVLGH